MPAYDRAGTKSLGLDPGAGEVEGRVGLALGLGTVGDQTVKAVRDRSGEDRGGSPAPSRFRRATAESPGEEGEPLGRAEDQERDERDQETSRLGERPD